MEIWKDIPGYEGQYQVSGAGSVRSLDRQVPMRGAAYYSSRKGRPLKPGRMDRFGHVSVALGRGNSQCVHSLVALAFIGPRPLNQDVAHLNGNGGDNRVENLAYVTRSENNRHVAAHGRRLVTLEQVLDIRRRVAAGLPHGGKKDLAAEYGITPQALSAIIGRTYYNYV